MSVRNSSDIDILNRILKSIVEKNTSAFDR